MSKWNDSYYSITINSSGYKFYGLDLPPDNPTISITIESDLTVAGTRMKMADTSISCSSDCSVSGIRVQLVSSVTSSESDLSVVSLKIAKAVFDASITSDTSIFASGIYYALSNLSGNSNISTSLIKITNAISVTSGDLSVTTTAIEILHASASLDGGSIVLAYGTEYQLAKVNIGIVSNLLLPGLIKFSNTIVEDTQFIRGLILIDDKPITEHNRKINTSIIQPMIENKNWKSTKSRYYKSSSGRQTFSLSWTQVPHSKENTVDLRLGRDYINQIGSDPDIHTLKVLNIDSNGTTAYTEEEYNVIVKSYSESLIRRDLVGDEYYWDCNLELEEV
jgi:hypothetical protein